VITGSPLLGEHTDEVLAELGYEADADADAVAKMHTNHVVG
jgi:crotonobetainyl-CoA:carnitine CoA-transferase CaiB-like acyl-CoA transferase